MVLDRNVLVVSFYVRTNKHERRSNMNPLRKSILALAISGATFGVGAGSVALIHGAVTEPQNHPVTSEQMATANDLSTAFRNVGKQIEPSVVNITVHKKVKGAGTTRFDFNDDMLRRFFRGNPGFEHALPNSPDQKDNPNQDDQNQDEGSFDQVGTGSGVIMEVDGSVGYILTNNHVAGDASEMSVTLADGRTISDAKLVGADPKSDLAVVKITADHLVPAKWGDSSTLRRGEWVLAFGSPFGYIGSMTHGIVSALDRSNVGILGSGGYEDFIQVDAPINPGNSGGPLVNLKGEVVGINTAIASHTGAFSGIGFAVPVNEARFIYTSLKDHGSVVRGWLGVSIGDISRDAKVAESFGYKGSKGVLVESALPNAPAAGQLVAGDIIENVDGKPVESVTELRNVIAACAPGTEIKMTVWRDKKDVPVTVKLGTQPKDMRVASGQGSAQGQATGSVLGMTLSDATDEMARRFSLGGDHQGAMVTHVKPGSPAEMAGLRAGDLIMKVNDKSVKSAAEASDLLKKRDVKSGVRLYVKGAEGMRFVFIEVK
jgi:serine protease Do